MGCGDAGGSSPGRLGVSERFSVGYGPAAVTEARGICFAINRAGEQDDMNTACLQICRIDRVTAAGECCSRVVSDETGDALAASREMHPRI